VAVDSDWSTIYRWKRDYLAVSTAQITWQIPANTPAGAYRIVHHGDAKDLLGRITAFTGASRSFTVEAS
jgi:neutral ceramidase